MQTEHIVPFGPQNSEFDVLAREKPKSQQLLPAAVGSLVLGNSVQHVVTQLTLQHLQLFEPVRLGVYS